MSTQWKWNSLQHSNFLSFLPINRCRGTHLEWIIFKIVFFSFLFNFFCHSFFSLFISFLHIFLFIYIFRVFHLIHPHFSLPVSITAVTLIECLSMYLWNCLLASVPRPPNPQFAISSWNEISHHALVTIPLMEATNGALGRLHHGSKTQPDLLVTNHLFSRFSSRKISWRGIALRLSFLCGRKFAANSRLVSRGKRERCWVISNIYISTLWVHFAECNRTPSRNKDKILS